MVLSTRLMGLGIPLLVAYMNIPGVSNINSTIPTLSQNGVDGIQSAEQRLARNVVEVARNEDTQSRDPGSQDRALVEQNEIVQAVRANARSLDAASQRIGTLIDISV